MGAARKPERHKRPAKRPRAKPAEGRKLTKVGNSYAAIIPRQVMAVLGMDGSDRVTYTTDGEALIIRPVHKLPKQKHAKFDRLLDETVEQYRGAIMVLAGR
ncbi:MAG TPA: AbrB/MazE/SpoVT family DNA-binding domain-containing protein [Planctomycetota bacterium]|nr:AbrB/MazE/SpoVT family DNA-binding domain-containing protein [Planctomycetota bacterium]